MALIIDGKKIAGEIREELRKKVEALKARGVTPGIAVTIVGENPASMSYVSMKGKACTELGIYSETHRFPADMKEADLLAHIEAMNKNPKLHGILVQLPLPKHLDEDKVILAISPEKDVDGFHPVSVGRMVIGQECYLPCTPWGCQELLTRSGIDPAGKHVVVVGRSNIVGKPVANILLQKAKGANATVTICHTGTKDIAYFTRQADILVVAAGRPKAITADMVKEGVVVIDVGVNEIGKTAEGKRKLVGDVDFDAIKEKASAITPVPNGVGPMTITMLMANTVKAAEKAAGK